MNELKIYSYIESHPPRPVDLVEVVRCKDCKWYEIYQLKQDGTDDRRYNPSYCTLFRHRFKPEWYCADGERREDEHRAYRTAEKIL